MQSAKTYNIAFTFSLAFVAAVRKDIRPQETFTFRSSTLNKHNQCRPQRHTIFLFDFLLSSWPQPAKTYDLKKHLLAYLLHLTNTIIAVRKVLKTYSIPCRFFSCLRGRHPQRHTTFSNIYFAVRKDIQYSFYIFPCLRGRVIYSARNIRRHDPTAPNTAPVTQKDSHT